MLSGVNSHPEHRSMSPETASQGGAGALLLVIALAELWLAYWTAGWLHRSGALLVAAGGGALLARAVAAAAPSFRVRAPRLLEERGTSSSRAAEEHVVPELVT